MSIDNRFLVKKVLQMDQLVVAFCGFTRMPFVYCDPVSYADQVWVFSDEAGLKEFAGRFTAKKIAMQGVIVKKAAYTGFFGSLLPIGVTEVVFTENGASASIPLEQFVVHRDMSNVPPALRPLENPQLQLTGLYLMQEIRRPVPNDEKENIADLNDEFLVNLARARFLMPVQIKPGAASSGDKKAKNQISFINLTLKNGDVYRPLFADTMEFNKFRQQKKDIQVLTIPFAGLKSALQKDTKGFLLDPNGCQIVMTPQLIDQVLQNYPESVKEGEDEAKKILASQAGPLMQKKPKNAPTSQSKITKMPDKGPKA